MMIRLLIFCLSICLAQTSYAHQTILQKDKKQPNIQVALLLDTSNSMDGLIEQAKSQLWKMVNELASSKKGGKAPNIDIALYEYGNSRLNATDGYLRQIAAMTKDLDLVSEKLFELTTQGGSEYCGWVINDAVKQLKWSDDNDDLKLIIIAGNEAYNQGPQDYKAACKNAISKGIMINTIFCGDYEEGVRTFWKDGAECADGQYLNIDSDEKVIHITTPHDQKILELNKQLNGTYIGYGNLGKTNIVRQQTQDNNAAEYSAGNAAERAVSKSQVQYKNTSWDLVDAEEEDEEVLNNLKDEQLPDEMKGMSKEEQKAFIDKKRAEREKIQAEIKELNKQRKTYIAKEKKKMSETKTLDNVMIEAVKKQAKTKSFKFE